MQLPSILEEEVRMVKEGWKATTLKKKGIIGLRGGRKASMLSVFAWDCSLAPFGANSVTGLMFHDLSSSALVQNIKPLYLNCSTFSLCGGSAVPSSTNPRNHQCYYQSRQVIFETKFQSSLDQSSPVC